MSKKISLTNCVVISGCVYAPVTDKELKNKIECYNPCSCCELPKKRVQGGCDICYCLEVQDCEYFKYVGNLTLEPFAKTRQMTLDPIDDYEFCF